MAHQLGYIEFRKSRPTQVDLSYFALLPPILAIANLPREVLHQPVDITAPIQISPRRDDHKRNANPLIR